MKIDGIFRCMLALWLVIGASLQYYLLGSSSELDLTMLPFKYVGMWAGSAAIVAFMLAALLKKFDFREGEAPIFFFLFLACLGILLFWITGFQGYRAACVSSFTWAGVSAWFGIGGIVLKRFRYSC